MVRVLTICLCLAAAFGCAHTAMDDLDEEVSRLIRDRRGATLGYDAPQDPQPVPNRVGQDPGGSPTMYNRYPGTLNPSEVELPATALSADATIDPEAIPDRVNLEGPDVLSMDLREAIQYAIEHSRDYKNEKDDLFSAVLNSLIQKHLFSPRFFTRLSATFSGTPEAGEYDQALDLVADAGVTQQLPYGGQVTASAVVSYTNLLRNASATPDDASQDTTLNLALNVPLMRGAGLIAQEDLIQSQRNLVYAAREFERFRREFFVGIATDYFDLIAQQDGIANQKQQVESFEWLYNRTEALERAGDQAAFEVRQAEQQLLFARNNLFNAQERYATSVDRFKIRLGMPTTQKLVIEPIEVVVPVPKLVSAGAVKTALAYRLDLQTTRNRVDDSRRRLKNARNGLLPDLDFDGTVSLPTDSDARYGGLRLDAGQGTYSAGLTLDLPVDKRIEKIAVRQALISLEQSERSLSLARDQVALDVRQAIRDVEQARYTLLIQDANIENSKLRMRGITLQERELPPRDFIDAQDDLLEARNRYDAAVRDLRVSVLNYLLDSGQMRVSSQGEWLPPAKLVKIEDIRPKDDAKEEERPE